MEKESKSHASLTSVPGMCMSLLCINICTYANVYMSIVCLYAQLLVHKYLLLKTPLSNYRM